jgi:type VII secretion-associated protein (TIGR03931 family)
MTIVVEVGPTTVRGPYLAEANWVSAGLEGIDDELILIDDQPVDVADVWRTIMCDVVDGPVDAVVVVCPTWWPPARVERVREAAQAVASDVLVMRRAEVLRDSRAALVEIGPEFVVVSSPSGVVAVATRGDIDALVARIPVSMAVVVDGPDEAGPLAVTIADRLRANGVDVTVSEADWVRCSVATGLLQEDAGPPEVPPTSRRGVGAVLAGTLLSAAALCGGYVARPDARPPTPAVPMTLLVEGRVGVMVPARWAVHRVTSGPGSARVQIVSPDGGDVALHVTQSSLGPQQTREQVAESLRSALSEAPEGVFVEFDPAGSRAEHSVLTYREIRADRHIAWFVLIDGSLRIAIGCQSAPEREEAVRDACDRAIQSAHAVF